jgi:3,4-dehydroadipyl-CoA semialdehyde dehydrogenase
MGGRWIDGTGKPDILVNPVNGTAVAHASSQGLDLAAGLRQARAASIALRQLGYTGRAALLGKTADVLTRHRVRYFEIALQNSGSPESDAGIDIDGALFTMKYFARAGTALGNANYLANGDMLQLSKDGSFDATHIAVPVRGAAIHINAFNFPAWGLWEKAAPTLLSGVAVVAKPATTTAWLTYEMIKDVHEAGIWPDGALSLICGRPGDLLDHLTVDDVLSITGSAHTAAMIRSNPRIVGQSVRVNVEADSVNSALLGPDATPGSPEFDLFINEVAREITVKAGQKCTAIRRALVPAQMLSAVRMGPLVNKSQQQEAFKGIGRLAQEAELIYGGTQSHPLTDASFELGAFVPPTLLLCQDSDAATLVHETEVFGPVATLLPYRDLVHAFALAHRGHGSLVASIYSGDDHVLEAAALELAATHGRVLAINASVGSTHTGHGNVMPQCLHGGPGRAGGGEELGGLHALTFYHRRAAIQGPAARIAALSANGANRGTV